MDNWEFWPTAEPPSLSGEPAKRPVLGDLPGYLVPPDLF